MSPPIEVGIGENDVRERERDRVFEEARGLYLTVLWYRGERVVPHNVLVMEL